MAGKKENLKSLFSNTRSRVIIIFTAVLLLLAVLIGYIKLKSIETGPPASALINIGPGGIQSIPGTLDPTAQYVKLQEQQNITQAEQALKTGGSSIPTIIKSQALTQGVGVISFKDEKTSGARLATVTTEDQEATRRRLWVQKLQDSSCSKSTIIQVVGEGAQLSDLKTVCSCVQLKDNGYALPDLISICACEDLKAAGFNARQLKDAGYTPNQLRACIFNACELRNAGFIAQDMKDAGFADGELKGAGFTDAEINKASGLPVGISAADVLKAGCASNSLNTVRSQGVSALAIRRITGCSVDQLKAGAFNAKELKNAGFSAADLRQARFIPQELKAAGYMARDLLNAGFSPDDLRKTDYTVGEIRAAEKELPPGVSAEDVKKSGCSFNALHQDKETGISAFRIRQDAGCSAQGLKAGAFSDADLANAGFNAEEIKAAIPLTDAQIKASASDPAQLKNLYAAGVSAKQIKELHKYNAELMKNAGFDAKSLLDAGYSPAELVAAGFSPGSLMNAGLTPVDIIAMGRSEGCIVDVLKKARNAGISAISVKKTLGCVANALKAGGYSAKDLKDAGFTGAELKNAGFSAGDLTAHGYSAKELKDAGFSPKNLKDVGFSLAQIKEAGFTTKEMKDAGFSVAQLKEVGFSPKEMKDAGFSAAKQKADGVSAKALKDAGFSAAELKAASFNELDLRNAGYSPDELQIAGIGAPIKPQGAFTIGAIPADSPSVQGALASTQQLQTILNKQNNQMAEQKYQQKIQEKNSDMLTAASKTLQEWAAAVTQEYNEGSNAKDDASENEKSADDSKATQNRTNNHSSRVDTNQPPVIKTGDILFAIMDTAVNSDEPGPILATIVSGKLKGTKLIGSFNVAQNASKMVITFNTMSIPGAANTTSISAYAIDPNTARTALSSKTNHHYLMRYGSLFASSFLQGIGTAFQSADTSVSVGGTGGVTNTTVQNGINRSTMQNAIIAMTSVGQAWGQQAQQVFNTPTTVEVYSGSPLGILFTQDVHIN